MKFRLFSEVKLEFEVSCPVALIESYCFQSDFYANYDLLPDRKVADVNSIGARIPKKQLEACKEIIDGTRSMPIFEYNKLGIDDFLDRDDETITKFVKEDLIGIVSRLTGIEGIGLSKATKVLHTVYPGIIPMIDSMLQAAYTETNSGAEWIENDSNQIFVAYYNNLKEQPTKKSLAEVYDTVSNNLPGLTKVRVFDIIWWSYLKAKRLREKNCVKWGTIR